VEEALDVYGAILERQPFHEIALPQFQFLTFVALSDFSARDRLLDFAAEHPENDCARRLSQQVTPFVGYLPEPIDPVAAFRRPFDSRPGRPRLELQYLIAPSVYLAYDGLRDAEVVVARMQTPDPRPPRRWVEYLLWKYDGLRPTIAVPPPAAPIAWAVVELANQQYQLEAWWQQARRLARQLKPEQFDDLLATMVYPPRPQQVQRLSGWIYRIQVATALVIAHIDTGWEGSLRRKALFSLANGPMDWTVDAALIALTAVARDDEEAAPEIGELFRELRSKLPKDGPVCYHQALLWSMLRLPDLKDEERHEIRAELQRWQNTQRAEPLFRQALAHIEARDFDKATDALAEVIRLAPAHVDAVAERASLSLRLGKAKEAVADYTRAIELRPEAPAIYLGRGRAHLKLGQFDQAIEDFSAAAKLAPAEWEAYHRRGLAHTARKNHEQAIADFSQAIRLHPDFSELYLHRALAYTQTGRFDLAIGDYSEQIRLNPQAPAAYNFRARLYSRQGRYSAAVDDHSRACELDPANANTHSQLARLWATCPDTAVRDGRRAVEHANKACELTAWKTAHCLDVLAVAHAECGQFEEATRWAEKAVALATGTEQAEYAIRLDTFRQGKKSQP
jgi:tetratricopeptide (TPR) repeat protein